MTKEEYLAKLQTHLDEWKGDLEHLKTKAAEATGEAKAKLDEQIAELAPKWEEGKKKLEEWTNTADDAWEELKVEAEIKWDQLTVSMKESVDRVKAYFS
jgi:predicted  nucleic acid-binding Zn-ribbon protein